jgi:hypothetical protein
MAEEKSGAKKRPGLLTVLCILTFIGSGLGILFWLFAIVGLGNILGFLGKIPGFAAGGGESTIIVPIVFLLLAIVLLLSAIMMWNLKKMGYYLYILVKILGIVLPIILLGALFKVTALIIPVIMVVLYGLNLKAMS